MMSYKGYTGKVEYDDEAELFHGQVVGTRDVITFQGKTVAELKAAFHDSVDDYLEFCESLGKDPEKPYSGKFVVRVDPGLHRLVDKAAAEDGLSLNAWITKRLKAATGRRFRKKHYAGSKHS